MSYSEVVMKQIEADKKRQANTITTPYVFDERNGIVYVNSPRIKYRKFLRPVIGKFDDVVEGGILKAFKGGVNLDLINSITFEKQNKELEELKAKLSKVEKEAKKEDKKAEKEAKKQKVNKVASKASSILEAAEKELSKDNAEVEEVAEVEEGASKMPEHLKKLLGE